jgi:predicted metal-dependent hydrolase
VYSKLAEKETHRQPRSRKEFVTGEGFSYLGRSYRLLLVGAQDRPLKLEGGRFKLRRSDAGEGRAHFVEWYAAHARPWLSDRVDRFAGKVGVTPTRIDVRDLGHRWGSCGAGGNLNFHWAVILLPPGVVEYVIVHELAHLREPRHSPEFWLLVERALPDLERRRGWLTQNGDVYPPF